MFPNFPLALPANTRLSHPIRFPHSAPRTNQSPWFDPCIQDYGGGGGVQSIFGLSLASLALAALALAIPAFAAPDLPAPALPANLIATSCFES